MAKIKRETMRDVEDCIVCIVIKGIDFPIPEVVAKYKDDIYSVRFDKDGARLDSYKGSGIYEYIVLAKTDILASSEQLDSVKKIKNLSDNTPIRINGEWHLKRGDYLCDFQGDEYHIGSFKYNNTLIKVGGVTREL